MTIAEEGHILACLKEIPFESSMCTFSGSKNASTISMKCLKNTIKKMLNSNYHFKFLLPLTESQWNILGNVFITL